MADIKLSGYKVTEVSIAWTSGQALDSLADNETTDLSDEVDNSTTLYALADVHMNLASAAFTGTDCEVRVYLVPTVDGTNYPTWDGNTASPGNTNKAYFVGSLPIKAATAACRAVLRSVALPNGKYKWAFRSMANVALAASGNTVTFRPHQLQSV